MPLPLCRPGRKPPGNSTSEPQVSAHEKSGWALAFSSFLSGLAATIPLASPLPSVEGAVLQGGRSQGYL